MKLQLGTNVYDARLRFLPRFQSWMVAVGPVIISRVGLERLGARLCGMTEVEQRQIAEAGLEQLA